MTPAEAYERFLVPAIFGPWARAALQPRSPTPGSRVLDVACGTGIGARSAAPHVGRTGLVVGADADPAMLAVARTSGRGPGEAPSEWLQVNAVLMPFRADAFDCVLCFEGLQFFPDRPAGLREMCRVLRPGGLLVATVWGPLEQNPAYDALAEGLRRFASAEAGRLAPFTLTDGDAIRALVLAAGFAEVTVSVESLRLAVPSAAALVDWVAAGGPTIRHNLALLRDDERQKFHDLVAARLEPYRAGQGLSLPSARNVIVARRRGD